MSECILADIFGVEGYKVARSDLEGDCLRIYLEVEPERLVCPHCGSREVSRKGRRQRELQTVPIGLTPVFLHTEVPKCQCRDCDHRFEVAPLLPRPIAGSPIAWWRSCKPSPKSCASPTSPT